tara:strand:- start:609 stop:725 length:117 start_codon:yes stop_codon:yes gene_type:complete
MKNILKFYETMSSTDPAWIEHVGVVTTAIVFWIFHNIP